jgi:hypothetical protein
LRISRHAVKSQCARGWGGWGQLTRIMQPMLADVV